jgi:hypothetical protein
MSAVSVASPVVRRSFAGLSISKHSSLIQFKFYGWRRTWNAIQEPSATNSALLHKIATLWSALNVGFSLSKFDSLRVAPDVKTWRLYHKCDTVITFWVRVPVLSVHITVVLPNVSIIFKFFTRTFFFAKRLAVDVKQI